ncbi:MAG: Pr6Pr family membrane protein [Mycetocola sp.]
MNSLNSSIGAWTNRFGALGWRVLAVIVITIGILRVSGLATGEPVWSAFLFYTTLSNVLCLIWMLMSAIRTVQDIRDEGWRGTSSPSPRFGGAVMMAITVTMLIYLVLLAPAAYAQEGDYEPFTLTDTLVHIITPLIVIIDWAVFVGKGQFRRADPVLWAIIPYIYLAFGFSRAALGGDFGPGRAYPYPFMNVTDLGVDGVAAWIAGLTVALIAVGYLYLLADATVARVVRHRANRPAEQTTVTQAAEEHTTQGQAAAGQLPDRQTSAGQALADQDSAETAQ